jgi:hypothetical protein
LRRFGTVKKKAFLAGDIFPQKTKPAISGGGNGAIRFEEPHVIPPVFPARNRQPARRKAFRRGLSPPHAPREATEKV